jgi:hypothetical protein
MKMEQHRHDIHGKTEENKEKSVPEPLCPPQSHWTDLSANPSHCGEKSVTLPELWHSPSY